MYRFSIQHLAKDALFMQSGTCHSKRAFTMLTVAALMDDPFYTDYSRPDYFHAVLRRHFLIISHIKLARSAYKPCSATVAMLIQAVARVTQYEQSTHTASSCLRTP